MKHLVVLQNNNNRNPSIANEHSTGIEIDERSDSYMGRLQSSKNASGYIEPIHQFKTISYPTFNQGSRVKKDDAAAFGKDDFALNYGIDNSNQKSYKGGELTQSKNIFSITD